MRITVELEAADVKDICKAMGEKKKGPAIRLMLEDALRMRRRRETASKFVSGEWGVALAGHEESVACSRAKEREKAVRWRK